MATSLQSLAFVPSKPVAVRTPWTPWPLHSSSMHGLQLVHPPPCAAAIPTLVLSCPVARACCPGDGVEDLLLQSQHWGSPNSEQHFLTLSELQKRATHAWQARQDQRPPPRRAPALQPDPRIWTSWLAAWEPPLKVPEQSLWEIAGHCVRAPPGCRSPPPPASLPARARSLARPKAPGTSSPRHVPCP